MKLYWPTVPRLATGKMATGKLANCFVPLLCGPFLANIGYTPRETHAEVALHSNGAVGVA